MEVYISVGTFENAYQDPNYPEILSAIAQAVK